MTTTVRGARARVVSKWTSEMGSAATIVAIVVAVLLTVVFLRWGFVFYFIVFFFGRENN